MFVFLVPSTMCSPERMALECHCGSRCLRCDEARFKCGWIWYSVDGRGDGRECVSSGGVAHAAVSGSIGRVSEFGCSVVCVVCATTCCESVGGILGIQRLQAKVLREIYVFFSALVSIFRTLDPQPLRQCIVVPYSVLVVRIRFSSFMSSVDRMERRRRVNPVGMSAWWNWMRQSMHTIVVMCSE